MRNCCLFYLCMRIKIFTCASMRMDPHMRIIHMNRKDPQPHGHPYTIATCHIVTQLCNTECGLAMNHGMGWDTLRGLVSPPC